MYERWTERTRRIEQRADREAQRLMHEYVGTEHLLLALASDESRRAPHVLKALGVAPQTVVRVVEEIVPPGPDMVLLGRMPRSPRAQQALEEAASEAREQDQYWIDPEHVLLGLLREAEGVAAQILRHLGVSLEEARRVARGLA
jgi:ATP-dependent Clp protease ATP-binding subunit ClpC